MTEKEIFDFFVAAGMTKAGAAGLMGNLIAESGLKSTNLENGYERAIGMDDETYTAAVDAGIYGNFVHDSAGYGLAQWTYHTRKNDLLQYARKTGKSIGDMKMQLEFMIQELQSYRSVWAKLKTAAYVRDASDMVLTQYERPADQSEGVKISRAAIGDGVLKRCTSGSAAPQKEGRRFSPLATLFVDFGGTLCDDRTQKIEGITPHHGATVTADPVALAKSHRDHPEREASAQYYIGGGKTCGGIPETERAWTSGSASNDQRMITIEVANSTGDPDWKISDQDYQALVLLCADICKHYGITPHFDGTTSGTITLHKMFEATACPGPYLEQIIRSGKFERDILEAMGKDIQIPAPAPTKKVLYRVQVGAFRIKDNARTRLECLKAQKVDGIVVQADGYYKVQVGAFKERANAEKMVEQMVQLGYRKTFITTKEGQMVIV